MTTSIAQKPARRIPAHPINDAFHARWSPRAFTGEEIPLDTLMGLFEAARWAPSALNVQPWRFVYARRGTPAFDAWLATLAPPNQAWARYASALVAVVSQRTFTPRGAEAPVPFASHSFDAGAAWAQLALQAQLWGWRTHAMGGFDAAAARTTLGVPEDHQIEVFVAVGKQGDPAQLPDWAKEREQPNDRKPLAELVREGRFDF
jgi:nitroreductase